MISSLAGWLEESRRLGFLGPGPIEPHLHHALAFASVVDVPPARALDLGAGGGLPGLVLAVERWPDTHWTFLDAQQKRTDFLERAVRALGLDRRIEVLTGRAELVAREATHRGAYELVVARSFGPPAVAAECAAGFLTAAGALVVSEPPPSPGEVRWPTVGLAELGYAPAREVVIADDDADEPVHLVRLDRVALASERYPRRDGVPTKRPVFGPS